MQPYIMYKSSQEKKWESVNISHVKEANLEKKEQDKSVPSRGGETTTISNNRT